MKSAYITRPTAWHVVPFGEPTFSQMATSITIVDEAAGEFVEVEQTGRDLGKIAIDPLEWPTLRAAIDEAISGCRQLTPPNQR